MRRPEIPPHGVLKASLHGVLEASLHGSQTFVYKLWIKKADILKKDERKSPRKVSFVSPYFFQLISLYYKELAVVYQSGVKGAEV
ncbi:MAG: hypothetical protein LBG22_02950 [Treponema sp.]|jgi:hypothetical protein|nr:hypothetical protein [Treponema sp.]